MIEQSLRIQAPPEKVWRYWTDPAWMSEWWGSSADLDPRPGGVCRVELAPGLGAVMAGEYVELEPYSRLVFTFGWEVADGAPPVAPGSTQVEVLLEPDGGGTVLTLRHHGLPVAQVEEHTGGWGHFLHQLAEAAA